MNNGFGVKPVFYFLGILFALGLLISIARMVSPAPAYASSVEQVPAISDSDAATIRFMCDGGKVTTTTIAKWQANGCLEHLPCPLQLRRTDRHLRDRRIRP